MLQNEYLVAKFGFDTAENEPLKVWGLIQFNIQSCPHIFLVAGRGRRGVGGARQPSERRVEDFGAQMIRAGD